jgi:hypothetical protein
MEGLNPRQSHFSNSDYFSTVKYKPVAIPKTELFMTEQGCENPLVFNNLDHLSNALNPNWGKHQQQSYVSGLQERFDTEVFIEKF